MSNPQFHARNKKGPEAKIQDALVKYLRGLEWFVKETHGNMYQSGFPDLYCCHPRFGHRWVEVKNPEKYAFTPAQIRDFPKFSAANDGIWILTAANETEYKKLFSAANWFWYLSMWRMSHGNH